MLLQHRIRREQNSIDNLLKISYNTSQNKGWCTDASLNIKLPKQNNRYRNTFISPWDNDKASDSHRSIYVQRLFDQSNMWLGKHTTCTPPEGNGFNQPKSRQESRRTVKFATDQSALCDENIKFYHFDDAREYMTHYRESVTLLSIMIYRKGVLSVNDKLSLCKKCAKTYSPYDLIKHCHCNGQTKELPSNLNSSYVCYVGDNNNTTKSLQTLQVLSSPQGQIEAEEKKS